MQDLSDFSRTVGLGRRVGTSCEEVDVRDVVVGDELGEDFGADETCGAGEDDFHGVFCFFFSMGFCW